ncbi:MAG: B12-binding domain-containing radical SAM protein [Promethearchaeota archaeon]
MSEEKVLLIFPPSFWGHKERFAQPLGILMLATILKQEGIDVIALDLSAEGWYPEKLKRFIITGSFTHVGVTILTRVREISYYILKMVKSINPNTTTLAGGPHVTLMKEKIFSECSVIDIAVAGEAELKIVDIIRKPSKKFYDLNYIEDINSLPIPDRSFIRHIKYNRLSNLWIGDSASMKWARGCPWRRCRFCSRPALDITHRRRNPDDIIKEIAIIQNELKYKNILIIDDSIQVKSKYAKEILSLKIKEGLDIPFWILTRADHMDEEGVRLMKRAGAVGFQVGLESVVPRVVDMYRKIGGDPRQWYRTLDRVFELANKYQLIVIATFIIGGPTETIKEIQTTVNYCRSAKMDFVKAFPFRFAYKSDLWQEAIQKGQLKPGQYDVFNDKSYGTTEFSAEEIFKLVLEAQYLNGSPILNPRRYLRLGRKLLKQINPLLYRNVIRSPLLIKNINNLRYHHLEKKGILYKHFEFPYKAT